MDRSNKEEIRKIYQKSKQIHNRKINLVTYFPVEVWDRKYTILQHYKTQQTHNKNFRYQIRTGTSNI